MVSLEDINKCIIEFDGKALYDVNQKLIESNMDSFSMTMIFLELDTMFGGFTEEQMNSIDLATITVKDIIEVIENHGNK